MKLLWHHIANKIIRITLLSVASQDNFWISLATRSVAQQTFSCAYQLCYFIVGISLRIVEMTAYEVVHWLMNIKIFAYKYANIISESRQFSFRKQNTLKVWQNIKPEHLKWHRCCRQNLLKCNVWLSRYSSFFSFLFNI